MSKKLPAPASRRGFTLIELLIVMGLITLLFGLTTVNLARPQTAASLNSIVDNLRADLRNQQLRAMSGDTGGTANAQTYGVYIQSGSYTLFSGTYAASNADNFDVTSDAGITISTTLPDSQVNFAKGTGEVSGLTANTNSITISDSRSGDNKTIKLNRYGTVTLQ